MADDAKFTAEMIAHIFRVPLHMVTWDLPPGYWQAEEARRIARRSLLARLRRYLRRFSPS